MRRSERIVRITELLVRHPNQQISLSRLAAECDAAKSSLSEDVSLIRSVLEDDGVGSVLSVSGAGGGVLFQPWVSSKEQREFIDTMCRKLTDPSRVLPGGFLYMSDVLGDPDVLEMAGRLFAQRFTSSGANVVVTVETKGIPLAVATAHYLNVPVVVVRRGYKVTDGAALTAHYISGSERRIQTMSISKRAMPSDARVLVVDDFMRAGATAKGVTNLLKEFASSVIGTAVFMATAEPEVKLVDNFVSIFTLGPVEEGKDVRVEALKMW